MLKIPAFQQFDGVTVYQDSDQDFVFYAIPDLPQLRYGDDGKPVFLFLKYRDAPGDVTAGASRGGGYVQFDTVLAVSEARLTQISATLQQAINAKYQAAGNNTPPKVQLAPASFIDDKDTAVAIHTLQAKPDGTGMVTSVVGFGKPSLIGSNVASFSIDLTQDGAALLWQAFQMATLPVSVDYDIKFLAQIPALTMHIWLHAQQLHTYYEQINEDVDPGTCSDTDVSYTQIMQEEFSKYSVAGVDITSWPSDLDGENAADVESFKQNMTDQGWSLLESTLKSDMTDKFTAETGADTGQASDYQNTVRSYLQSYSDDLDVMFTDNQVVKWPIHPQATLQGFLTTPGPDGKLPNKADFFKEISLDDPFFRMLQVQIHCNADFTNDPIYAVKVHVEYGSSNNPATFLAKDYVFTDNTTVQTFQTYIDQTIGVNFTYSAVISYKNSTKTLQVAPKTSNETQLILGVNDFGYLSLQIIAAAFNWDVVASAQVHIKYEDDANGVPLQEDVVQLTKSALIANYQRTIFAPVTQPYQYKVVYFLTNEQQVVQDWISNGEQLLLLNDVFSDHIAVQLLAAGFDNTNAIVIDLDYEDPAHTYSVQKTLQLSSNQSFLTWLVPIYGGATKAFKYKSTVLHADSTTEQNDWQTATGSQTLIVGDVVANYLTVNILADLLDFTQIKLARVTLHYTDPANAVDTQEDFVFTPASMADTSWKIAIKDKTKTGYVYSAAYYMMDGTERDVPVTAMTTATVVLQLPAAPAAPAAAPPTTGSTPPPPVGTPTQ